MGQIDGYITKLMSEFIGVNNDAEVWFKRIDLVKTKYKLTDDDIIFPAIAKPDGSC